MCSDRLCRRSCLGSALVSEVVFPIFPCDLGIALCQEWIVRIDLFLLYRTVYFGNVQIITFDGFL